MLTTPSSQSCHLAHFKRGFEEFQTIYRLNVTGHCDAVTKMFMSKSRCGQPDLFDVDEIANSVKKDSSKSDKYDDSSSSESDESGSEKKYIKKHKGREKRSMSLVELLDFNSVSTRDNQLKDLIAKEEVDNQKTYNNGRSTRKRRSFNFVVTDPIGKLNKDIVTWRLMSAHTNPSMTIATQNALLAQAFRYWAEVAPICFRQDKTAPRVDIEVGFLEG